MLGIRMKPLRRFAELNQTLGFSTASCYQAPDKLFKKIDIELRWVIFEQVLETKFWSCGPLLKHYIIELNCLSAIN